MKAANNFFMAAGNKNDDQNLLLQYAGFATQLLVSLGVSAFAGYEIDKWIQFRIPVFIWLLPLIVLIILLYKVMRDTQKNNNE